MGLLRKLLETAFPDASWEVDLHGMKVAEALETVQKAVEAVKARGGGRVRIITGKGLGSPGQVGVLREAVGGWLDSNGYGPHYTRKVERDGRDGSITVNVKP